MRELRWGQSEEWEEQCAQAFREFGVDVDKGAEEEDEDDEEVEEMVEEVQAELAEVETGAEMEMGVETEVEGTQTMEEGA